MPLRNRQDEEEAKLIGVNLVADPIKLKLGSFVSLQNWVPAKRYKIKKKRGVAALSTSETIIFPAPCEGFAASLSFECGHDCPTQFAEAEAQFTGSESPGGPAIRVSNDSVPSSVTAIAAIYVPIQNKIVLARWNAEDLSDLPVDIISVDDLTLNNGDVLRIEASADDSQEYTVKVNGTPVLGPTVNTDIDPLNDCIGFLTLEGATIP